MPACQWLEKLGFEKIQKPNIYQGIKVGFDAETIC